MSALAPFLDHLFATGEAVLRERPELSADERRDVEVILRSAFNEYRLEIAGPSIDFDPVAAVGAGILTARACWFAVSRDEPPEQVAALLVPPEPPMTAAAHLSIDLALRYAATVYRRAYAQNAEDVLATRLAETLRRCPLTGALADIAAKPAGDLTFAGHQGLELLYAERLAACYRPAWLPEDGRTREVVELVYHQQGKKWPPE
jgi:MoxR-vWA-beta-propeller ternary system domain bpX4